MALDNRVFIEEYPPAYDAGIQAGHPKPSSNVEVVEELPAYSAYRHPPPPPPPPKASPQRRLQLVFVLAIIVAAVIGGVLGYEHHRNKQVAADEARDSPNPLITALAATECNAGTFVFYQTNTSEIWMQGSLREGWWNGTESAQIPALRLDFDAERRWPIYGTNLTAICWTDVDESIDQDIIELRFYYFSFSTNIIDYSLVEASFTLPYPTSSKAITYPISPIPVTQLPLVNISTPSSVAATYLPDLRYIRLYYLTPQAPSPLSPAHPTTAIPSIITELSCNATSSWSLTPNTLNATSLSPTSALTVTSTITTEIHLVFMNTDNELAHLMWVNEIWSNASPILDSNTGTPILNIKDLRNIATIAAPGINPTELRVYYLENHLPYELILTPHSPPSTYSSSPPPTTHPNFPLAMQDPPLIAAATTTDTALNTTSIFYIWAPNTVRISNGAFIINETMSGESMLADQELWIAGPSLDVEGVWADISS